MWNIIIIILINVWCISIISISIIIYYLLFIICRLQQRGFWIFFCFYSCSATSDTLVDWLLLETGRDWSDIG